MTGVIKTILFLVVLYYAWKLLFRLMFPVVLRKATEKAQQTMNDRMRDAQAQRQGRQQEGEVFIQKGAGKRPPAADSDGEYVDFEEVK